MSIFPIKKRDKHGFVYILAYSDHPDVLKIGETYRYPYDRANDINTTTGVIGNYSVIWFMNVPHRKLAETMIQYKLACHLYKGKDIFTFNGDRNKKILEIERSLLLFFNISKDERATELVNALGLLKKRKRATKLKKRKKELQEAILQLEFSLKLLTLQHMLEVEVKKRKNVF
jgi:hypothetical protein